MVNKLIILFGKLASKTVQMAHLGHGSTWPGHIALKINKHFVRDLLRHTTIPVIIIAGTNGKTTSSLMLRAVLEESGKKVLHNESGANLLNGIASSLLLNSSIIGHIDADFIIFEVDENSLPGVLQEVSPSYLLLLNLFRDQLDRYGEITTIAEKWKKAITSLPEKTVVIANADDPKTAYLGLERSSTLYFGLTEKNKKSSGGIQAVDSVYCPRCHTKLLYTFITYSHLGDWYCPACKLRRPDFNISDNIILSLTGTYNKYNAHGIIVLSRQLGTQEHIIANALKNFSPAFGRQEKITFNDKKIQLFLSKNPTGFNESLHTINDMKGKYILLVLNDRIADGTDVSWIWDIDMETYLPSYTHVMISGDRAYDLGLRVKYLGEPFESKKWLIEKNIEIAIQKALGKLPSDETLYILPTYTAMLEVRKLLTGKKIL